MGLQQLVEQLRRAGSETKRLRVVASSDPERSADLADALTELTGLRLASWEFTEAASEAPESVVLSARILAARGPVGPYASISDVVRYVTATVQLAAIQACLGQAAAADRVMTDLDAWLAQVSRLPVNDSLPLATHAWAALARARAALDSHVDLANTWADAAEQVAHSTELPAYLQLAIHLLTADCRWAAGHPRAALDHHQLALRLWQDTTATVTADARPAVRALALGPLAALHGPYAARLRATGDQSDAIATLRSELDWAQTLGATPEFVAGVRLDLVAELLAAGREIEASLELAPTAGPVEPSPAIPVPPEVAWSDLPPVALRPGSAPTAAAAWLQAQQRAAFERMGRRLSAEAEEAERRRAAETHAAQIAAEQERAERTAAAEAAQAAAQAAAEQAEARRVAAERAEQERVAAREAAERRRQELAQAHRSKVDPAAAEAAARQLDQARAAVRAAGEELSATAAATEQLAELLRPLAELDPEHRAELIQVLESLVSLRWRLGQPDTSRAAAREARLLGEGT